MDWYGNVSANDYEWSNFAMHFPNFVDDYAHIYQNIGWKNEWENRNKREKQTKKFKQNFLMIRKKTKKNNCQLVTIQRA